MISLFLACLAILSCALAAPHPDVDPIHIPIVRRSTNPQNRVADLRRTMDSIRLKYGFKPVNRKRSVATSSLLDEQADSSYSATVGIGTPSQPFNLVLDTGSSDLWVATNQCITCTTDIPLFDTAKSSTYKNDSVTVQLNYGSGSASGYTSQDTVNFVGFTISDQELLSVSATSSNLIGGGLSGIMGLGFQTLSSLNTTPFWQSLYNQNKLSSPVFAFYLERHVNDTQQQSNPAPGGTFTLGGTNTSLYTGSVEFIDMPSGSTPSYWLQQVQTVTVQGKSISISSNDGLAAIDTGTSLIGAPSAIAQEIWANVPGSVAMSGPDQGTYAFPCKTTVNVSLSFGGNNWAISAADMNTGPISGSGSNMMCAGGIFDIGSTVGNGQGAPAWIIGDTFLKNVYSVFQANPPAVGFAQLANGLNGSGVAVSNSSSTSSTTSSASPTMSVSISLSLVMSLLAGFFITL